MNKDIETVKKNDKSKQIFQKAKWRTIYEVIDKDYFENSNIFPDTFIKQCKLCPNEPQFISRDVKNNIKRMTMEQILFAQVIKFWRKDLKFDATVKALLSLGATFNFIDICFLLFFTSFDMVCGSFGHNLHCLIKVIGNIFEFSI